MPKKNIERKNTMIKNKGKYGHNDSQNEKTIRNHQANNSKLLLRSYIQNKDNKDGDVALLEEV